jgi:hypothetical protein
MKQILLLLALVVALVPFVVVSAAAQRQGQVKPALGGYVLVPASPPIMAALPPDLHPNANKPPEYCKPCLFYTGDMDPNSSENNALFNADDGPLDITAYVYGAFTVPKGKIWTITALFINTLSNATAVDPTLTWDIRKGVTTGSGGTDVKTATGKDTWAATGRSAFGYSEYTNKVTFAKKITLKAGTYFMNVLTSCTTSTCNGDEFYETDQEHQPGINQYGASQPWDDSYFYATNIDEVWVPTWGSNGVCGGIGCDQFSIGAQGTQK